VAPKSHVLLFDLRFILVSQQAIVLVYRIWRPRRRLLAVLRNKNYSDSAAPDPITISKGIPYRSYFLLSYVSARLKT
jgi:hypothetical protein